MAESTGEFKPGKPYPDKNFFKYYKFAKAKAGRCFSGEHLSPSETFVTGTAGFGRFGFKQRTFFC